MFVHHYGSTAFVSYQSDVFPLDSVEERGVEAFSGTDSQDDFNRMTNIILQTDGLVGWKFMNYEETLTFMRNQGIDC